MKIFKTLFPSKNRTFKYKRWLEISLRTLHLIGVAGVCAGAFFHVPHYQWQGFSILTSLSGILFILLELWSNGIWLIQLRGVILYIKIIFLLCIPLLPAYKSIILIIVIGISSIISHAPGDVRYFSIIHGKRMDTF
jgi:hypothetical protein